MCGILGFVDKKEALSKKDGNRILNEMMNETKYRGHDSTGIYVDNNVYIGHNRLAIIDTSITAKQPYISNEKRTVISYNGEIYNHTELRNMYTSYEYKTHSDTETLVETYEKGGNKIFEQIRGMFAVSIYSPDTRKIVLSLDRFGIKPLYYINTPDWFAWSSELKVFKHLPGVKFILNDSKLFEHITFRTTTGSETLFKEIYRVNPAEILSFNIQTNRIDVNKYSYSIENSDLDIDKLLHLSIGEHVLSDVPVGFQLSGGIDSSLISTLAVKTMSQKSIHSFSIGLKDPSWNEFQYSREVANLIGTNHHEIEFTQDEFCKNLPIAAYHLDEPIVYPNTVAIMMLSKEARRHVKVLLSGEGADEIFGGYLRYLRFNKLSTSNDILQSNRFCSDEELSYIFVTKDRNIGNRLAMLDKIDNESVQKKLGSYDIQTFLPSLLLRQDKMGMAHNIENRFPFLDPRLVSAAMNLSDEEKCHDGQNKVYLKRMALKYLPKNIVQRRKCGFGLPISAWLRDQSGLGKYLTMFKNPRVKRNYLNYCSIEKYINEHISHKKDNSEILWVLICLEIWTRIYIDNSSYKDLWGTLSASKN
jgi:asparagine synthase (glutamine-hydrolysing)